MAWPAGPTPKTAADLFKPASKVAQHKNGLKLLVYGVPETMKTGFALSFPEPVFIFDTELGAPPLFKHFVTCNNCKKITPHKQQEDPNIWKCDICGSTDSKMKDIQWCDATFLNPTTGMHDPMNALQSLESAISLLKTADPPPKTIIVDSGTDVWDWMQEWLDEIGKHTQKGDQLMRTEWYKARLKWKKFILELMAKPIHFVMTAQTQDVYDKMTKQPTGEIVPRVEKTTSHTFDIALKMWKAEIPQANGTKKVEYHADVTKCRFMKGWRPNLPQELTFDKLTEQIKKDLGVVVW